MNESNQEKLENQGNPSNLESCKTSQNSKTTINNNLDSLPKARESRVEEKKLYKVILFRFQLYNLKLRILSSLQ